MTGIVVSNGQDVPVFLKAYGMIRSGGNGYDVFPVFDVALTIPVPSIGHYSAIFTESHGVISPGGNGCDAIQRFALIVRGVSDSYCHIVTLKPYCM